MKPQLLKISLQPRESFTIRHDKVAYFYNQLHFHPEIELVHIIKGTGMQFVGNHIHSFKPNDMIMVGSNLPHLWKSDQEYFKNQHNLKSESCVIHFLPNAFGDIFFTLPENNQINKILALSKHGLIIKGSTKTKVALLIQQLKKAIGPEKIILLIQILSTLSSSKDIVKLNKTISENIQTGKETERMNAVLQFLLNNFSETILLNQVAKIANMSTNAFCRYFKTNTKKTFSTFLLELRINHACKLLAESNKSVATICYESGFNNLSNFNRYFKSNTFLTPLQYRNKYQ